MSNIILGHNPFFGVNHRSQKAGIKKAIHFQDVNKITEFLSLANSRGYKSMMTSTHPLAIDLCRAVCDSNLKDEITFYPLLPYMQKYVRQANENGILSMMNSFFSEMGAFKGSALIAKAGISKLFNDMNGLIKAALEIEFSYFKGLKCERVFLHNALTDLAIGMKMSDPIHIFIDYINNKLKLKAGFGTLNLPVAINMFDKWGISDQYFMAPFNKIGHQMNPSLESNCNILNQRPDVKILAMSTLASGALKPEEAFQFLASIQNIDSIVVGISTDKHLNSTYTAFKQFSGNNIK